MSMIENEPTPGTTTLSRIADTLKPYERWGLAIGVILQLGVLLAMIVMRVAILVGGETYYVRVQPVDPRDLMRGDYVILGYEFSRVPHDGRVDWDVKQGPLGDRKTLNGGTIYVSLEPEGDGKHWRAQRFTMHEPDRGPFLRGKVNEFGMITYGIESYFVQEGKGRAYEEAVRSGRLTAEIAVKPDGEVALRKLHIEMK